MLRSIDLRLADRLKDDPEFRREWFRAELETSVPFLFRSLRERREYTQSDLAQLADMKQSSISRFEASADAKWKFQTLMKLADALNGRLWIGLEAAEDAIGRIERDEQAGLIRASVIDRDSNENLNEPKRDETKRESATKVGGAELPKQKSYSSPDSRWTKSPDTPSWN